MTSGITGPIGYIVSRFPKVTETFIANEMCSVAARDLGIHLFAMVRTDEPVVHRSTASWMPGMTVGERRPTALLLAEARWLRRNPRRLTAVWWHTIGAAIRTPRLLAKSIYATAVGVHWADDLSRMEHVHAHWATYPAQIAWVANRLTGVGYSVTAHAHDIQTANPMMSRKLEDAAAVVTISEFNRAFLLDRVGSALAPRLHVIHCGVDSARFVERNPSTTGGSATFVCVASFMPYKGHSVLLDAFAEVVAAFPEARLRLIGDGDLRDSIEDRIRSLDIADSVELLGWRSSEEVAEIVGSSTAFVLASIVLADGQTEGIPVALMEAMASGVPVVATRVSGVPELVIDGRTGVTVPPGDAEQLARAMKNILEDPSAAEERARQAIDHVHGEFDQETNADRLVDLFRTLIDAPGEAGRRSVSPD